MARATKKRSARKAKSKVAKRKPATRKSTKRKATRKGSVPAGGRAEVVRFVATHMRKKPDITMTELKKLGRSKGHNIYPLIIGLARKELGIARKTKRVSKTTRRAPGRRGPGRPRTRGTSTDAIHLVLDRIRELERDHARLRLALDKILAIASEA